MKLRRAIQLMISLALAAVGVFALRWVIPWGASFEWDHEWGSMETRNCSLAVSLGNNSLVCFTSTFPHEIAEDHMWSIGIPLWADVPEWCNFKVFSYFARGFIHRGIIVPLWFVALISLPYPILTVRSEWRLFHRKRRGHCLKCGYDLTGNVTGKCSECGTAIQLKPNPQ